MSWKKYFTPVPVNGEVLSPISGLNNGSRPGPARTNYSSYLPDVYSGSPNRVDRYQQYEVMDADPEVNAALDILAEFCTQKLKESFKTSSPLFNIIELSLGDSSNENLAKLFSIESTIGIFIGQFLLIAKFINLFL